MSEWSCAFKVWRGDDPEQEPEEVVMHFEVEFDADVQVAQADSVPWPT